MSDCELKYAIEWDGDYWSSWGGALYWSVLEHAILYSSVQDAWREAFLAHLPDGVEVVAVREVEKGGFKQVSPQQATDIPTEDLFYGVHIPYVKYLGMGGRYHPYPITDEDPPKLFIHPASALVRAEIDNARVVLYARRGVEREVYKLVPEGLGEILMLQNQDQAGNTNRITRHVGEVCQ